ncbi:hypothetical protein C2G38_2187866 [Gigaspora rosea]|uniref:Uncharacterized protein n=1 Tax=Gigaspora rosea TaxID=44941 RepID=A0A397VD52_9GLOM|nr:hypothetical protein C2G38_2187866 [Gigaspora rosea]
MYQFCINLQKLENKYIFNDDYLKDAQDFNVKYKETLKTNTNYNYAKLQNIDSEDKIISLLSFAYNIKEVIHFNKEDEMNFSPIKKLPNPENNPPKQYKSKVWNIVKIQSDDDSFSELFKFQIKYYNILQNNKTYMELQKIDDEEEKLYQFVVFALAIKNELHPPPIDEKLFTIIEEK